MDHYLIVKPDLEKIGHQLVWNYRKKEWSTEVTNGCRYKAVKTRAGTTSPRRCDQHLYQMADENVQIFLERYIRGDFYGQAFSKGLIFIDVVP